MPHFIPSVKAPKLFREKIWGNLGPNLKPKVNNQQKEVLEKPKILRNGFNNLK